MSRLYIVTLFNLYEEYIMRNAGLEVTQAGIKITGRNIIPFQEPCIFYCISLPSLSFFQEKKGGKRRDRPEMF